MTQDGNDALIDKVISYGRDTLSQKERDFAVAALRAGSRASDDSDVHGYSMAVADSAAATGEVTTGDSGESMSTEEFETLVGKLRDLTGELPQDEANALATAFNSGVQQTRADDGGEVEGYTLTTLYNYQPVYLSQPTSTVTASQPTYNNYT